MRLIINLVLFALTIGLVWVLYSTISEPIEFKAVKDARRDAVVDRLVMVRNAQELYRDITGEFAADFDTLDQVLREGKVMLISVYGDPDDPSNTDAIRYDTTYTPAIQNAKEAGIVLDSLPYIPYSSGQKFDIQADTLTYQKTLVNVVQVGTRWKNFMGAYADGRFARYDNSYDPNKTIKFGNMNAPNTSGNWER